MGTAGGLSTLFLLNEDESGSLGMVMLNNGAGLCCIVLSGLDGGAGGGGGIPDGAMLNKGAG